MRPTMKALTVVCLGILAFLAVGDVIDLIAYLRDPAAYGFGTEVAGFRYLSPVHFVGSIISTVLGAAAAFGMPRLVRGEGTVLAIRITLVVIFIGLRYW
jgi:hypothetical protein